MIFGRFATIGAIAGALTLAACANPIPGSPATSRGMTVSVSQAAVPNAKFKQDIAVGQVSGGEPTHMVSKVDNESFKKALEDSLVNVGYLAPAGTTPEYTLDANLQSLDQPQVGLSLDVTSKVDYTLSGDGMIKHLPITATGTAALSDSFSFVKRLRLANEKSIQENITGLLQQLQSQ